MSGFIEGEDRTQATLFPERIDDYITEDGAVRVIDVFVDELDLSGRGFKTMPEATGRPGTVRRSCSSYSFMDTSTVSSPPGASNMKPIAT